VTGQCGTGELEELASLVNLKRKIQPRMTNSNIGIRPVTQDNDMLQM